MVDTGCTAHRHGTVSAYVGYGCRCGSARQAWRRYRKRRSVGIQPAAYRDATGTHRRVRALQALGHAQRTLAARLGGMTPAAIGKILERGRVHTKTAAAVAEVYEALCMTPGTCTRTANAAAKKGWLPPLAWDDIDSDDAPASTHDTADRDVDEVAVLRATHGRISPARITRAERADAVARLAAQGRPSRQIAEIVGVSWSTVQRDHDMLAMLATQKGFGHD